MRISKCKKYNAMYVYVCQYLCMHIWLLAWIWARPRTTSALWFSCRQHSTNKPWMSTKTNVFRCFQIGSHHYNIRFYATLQDICARDACLHVVCDLWYKHTPLVAERNFSAGRPHRTQKLQILNCKRIQSGVLTICLSCRGKRAWSWGDRRCLPLDIREPF